MRPFHRFAPSPPRSPLPATRALAILLLACVALYGATCRFSSGHDEDDDVYVDIVTVHTDGVPLGTLPLPLDAPVTVEFDRPVDPGSVTPETVRVRRVEDGVRADGALVVDGAFVTFHPRPPTSPDLSDGGLAPGTSYRLEIPCAATDRVSVRGRSGETIRHRTEVAFETVTEAPLFRSDAADPPFRVLSLRLGSDAAGATLVGPFDPIAPAAADIVAGLGPGGEGESLRLTFVFSGPLDPSAAALPGAFRFEERDRLVPDPASPWRLVPRPLPIRVQLAPRFDRAAGVFRMLATLEVEATVEERRAYRAVASRSLVALGGEPLLDDVAAVLETGHRP